MELVEKATVEKSCYCRCNLIGGYDILTLLDFRLNLILSIPLGPDCAELQHTE